MDSSFNKTALEYIFRVQNHQGLTRALIDMIHIVGVGWLLTYVLFKFCSWMFDRSENTTFYAVIVYQGDEVNTEGAI